MLDINLFRENPDQIRELLRLRQMDSEIVDQVIALDQERRSILINVEGLKAERNLESRNIGKIKDPDERSKKIQAMRLVGDQITALDETLKVIETNLNDLLATIPNTPDPNIAVGKSEEDNVIIKTVGKIPKLDFDPLPHWDLGPQLGIIDFERG